MAGLLGVEVQEGFRVYVPDGTPPEKIRAVVEGLRARKALRPEMVIRNPPQRYVDEVPPGNVRYTGDTPPRPYTVTGGGVQDPNTSGLDIQLSPEPLMQRPAPPRYVEPQGGGVPQGQFRGNEALPKLTGDMYNAAVAGSVGQGLMGEFFDEGVGAFSATADSILGSEPGVPLGQDVPANQPRTDWSSKYSYYRDRARKLDEALMSEDPAAAIGGRVVGALATGVGALPRVSRSLIGNVAPQMAERLAARKGAEALPTLTDRAVDAATQGALAGAVSGAGAGHSKDGEDDVADIAYNRLGGLAQGAGFGTALGAAIPLTTSALGVGGRGLQSLLLPGTVNAERRAASVAAQDIGNTGLPSSAPQAAPTTAAQSMAGPAGPAVRDLALADVSDQARKTLGHVARGKGDGATKATTFMRTRQHGMPEVPGEAGGGQWVQVNRHIREVISGVGLRPLLKKLGAGMSAQAKQLYGKAFAHPPIDSTDAVELASNPDVQKGLRQGIRIARNLGELPDGVVVPKSGEVVLPVNVWHTAKMGIDDMIGTAHRAGNKNLARSLIHLQERVLNMLHDATDGDYTIARNAYSSAASARTAAELGTEFMDAAVKGADVAESLARMTDLEKQFYLAGAAESLINKVESLPTGADSARKFFNTPQINKKLAALLPDEATYADFIRRLKVESEKFKTFAELEGSQTAGRQSVGQAVEEAIDGGLDPAAIVSGGGGSVFRYAMNWMRENSQGPLSVQVKNHLAHMLSTTDPVEQRHVADLFKAAAERILARRRFQARARGGVLNTTFNAGKPALMREDPHVYPKAEGFRKSPKDGRWYRPRAGETWESAARNKRYDTWEPDNAGP